MNEMNDEMLEVISGGTAREIQELYDFIKTHDQNYMQRELTPRDAVIWLKRNCPEMGRSKLSYKEETGNFFYINGQPYSHEQMMEYLGKKFPA